MNLSSLSKKFDKEIREECDNLRLKLDECLGKNELIKCKNQIRNFNSCKEMFILKFYKNHSNHDFTIIRDN